jgi:hypothetical protein
LRVVMCPVVGGSGGKAKPLPFPRPALCAMVFENERVFPWPKHARPVWQF